MEACSVGWLVDWLSRLCCRKMGTHPSVLPTILDVSDDDAAAAAETTLVVNKHANNSSSSIPTALISIISRTRQQPHEVVVSQWCYRQLWLNLWKT